MESFINLLTCIKIISNLKHGVHLDTSIKIEAIACDLMIAVLDVAAAHFHLRFVVLRQSRKQNMQTNQDLLPFYLMEFAMVQMSNYYAFLTFSKKITCRIHAWYAG